MADSEIIDESILEGLGISRPAYEEIQTIIGRLPTVDELSTLLAMWHSQGTRQGLLSWLRGQPHSTERHDYIENDLEPESRQIPEPRVKECIAIARSLFPSESQDSDDSENGDQGNATTLLAERGDAIYMVGDVSEFFVDSDYGRRYLHLVADAVTMDSDEETMKYLELILQSLTDAGTVRGFLPVGHGGLFGTLLRICGAERRGFDILTCREVRLDAFLFGERGVRYITLLQEPDEDFFLQKLSEARVNCCFLGRVTKGRILVDDMDFGPVGRYRTA